MSLEAITFDVWRSINQSDSGGGEIEVPGMIYGGLEGSLSFPDKDAVYREETGQGSRSGPGPLTRSDRVVFIEPWDGSVVIYVADEVKPNPPVVWLPSVLRVVGVRGYPDDGGELQLDVEDVN